MIKRNISVRHSQIFDYWKDKAITRDGKIVPYDDMSIEAIPVVFDWGEPKCWACGRRIDKVFDYATYEKYLSENVNKIWDYAEVAKNLNKCHIIPHCIGGADEPENLFLLCEGCHIESPDTENPENFFRWIYRRRKSESSINGFIISQMKDDFLYWCAEKGKNPYTAKPEFANPIEHGGRCSQSSLVMALVDTCDSIRTGGNE